MERIEGDIIGNGWVKRIDESKAKLLSQLRNMVTDISSVSGRNRGCFY